VHDAHSFSYCSSSTMCCVRTQSWSHGRATVPRLQATGTTTATGTDSRPVLEAWSPSGASPRACPPVSRCRPCSCSSCRAHRPCACAVRISRCACAPVHVRRHALCMPPSPRSHARTHARSSPPYRAGCSPCISMRRGAPVTRGAWESE
jgi:hypothetical protein